MISFTAKYHTNEKAFYQPTFTRYRYALRSPLNSERLNSQYQQFRYDVGRLYQKTDSSNTNLDGYLDASYNGLSENISINDVIGTLPGLEKLASRLQGYSDRLEILEKGLI